MEKATATGNPAPSSKNLTKREGQVLTFVFKGLSNKEIAGRSRYQRVPSKRRFSSYSKKPECRRAANWFV